MVGISLVEVHVCERVGRVQRKSVLQSAIQASCSYNPGQNCLRKFSPSCPLSYATKLFPKRRLCGKKTPSPNSMLLPHKRPGIRLSFEYTKTLLSGEGREGRTGTATMFQKMLSKYTIFSTVLSKIVACTSPQVISTSPKTQVLISRVDYSPSVI